MIQNIKNSIHLNSKRGAQKKCEEEEKDMLQ